MRRSKLPCWPVSPNGPSPSVVVGELYHPTGSRENSRPFWLVIPETGLYTGVLIVGAIVSGKTFACMYPFAQQLLSWQADRPELRIGARILEEARQRSGDGGIVFRGAKGSRITSQCSVSCFDVSASKNASRDEVLVPRLVLGDGRDARGGRGRACTHMVQSAVRTRQPTPVRTCWTGGVTSWRPGPTISPDSAKVRRPGRFAEALIHDWLPVMSQLHVCMTSGLARALPI